LRTHGTSGTIHLSPGSQPHLTPAAPQTSSIKGAAAVRATLRRTSDARFFSSYRVFSHQTQSASGRIQMLMTPQHRPSYACPFSATLADAIMAATPLCGVVDDGTMDEENRASGEGIAIATGGDGGSLVPGSWPWQQAGDLQGLTKSRRRRKRRGALIGWRVDFQASWELLSSACGSTRMADGLHQHNEQGRFFFSHSFINVYSSSDTSRDTLIISPPARIGSFHCAVRHTRISRCGICPHEVEVPSSCV